MGETSAQILRALDDEHPAAALARLHRSPHLIRLLGQLFVVALRRGFAGHDPRQITGYVQGLLFWLDLPPDGLLARQTEAVIRAALGEPALAANIDLTRRHEIICTVIGDLTRPPGPARTELQSLLTQATQRLTRTNPTPPRR